MKSLIQRKIFSPKRLNSKFGTSKILEIINPHKTLVRLRRQNTSKSSKIQEVVVNLLINNQNIICKVLQTQEVGVRELMINQKQIKILQEAIIKVKEVEAEARTNFKQKKSL